MFKKKSLLSLSMVLALAAVSGCGDDAKEPEATPTPLPTKALSTPTPKPTDAAQPEPTKTVAQPTDAPTYTAGSVVDFEDGNYSFIKVKESNVDSAETELSIVDFGGSKALKIAAADTSKIPYVAIDISSLAGDAVANVRSIEMDMGISHDSGKFYAASGICYYYVGEDNTEKEATWSVYLEAKNPKRATFKLADDENFVAGAKNIIIVTKETDNAAEPTAEGTASVFYIDNIVLKDADGKEIALNTAAEFNAPDGFSDQDWSNLTQVKNEVVVSGMEEATSGSWWPESGITTDAAQEGAKFVDPSIFGPGKVMTIYLAFADTAEDWQKNVKLVGQWWPVENSEISAPTWEPFSVPDVAELTVNDDGIMAFNFYNLPMNDSRTIAQISYDAIAEHLGDDWFKYVKFLGIADSGAATTVSSVTVGEEKKVLPATINDVAIDGFAVKGAGWEQGGVDTVNAGGTFDISLLKPGCVITINYKSEGSMWLVGDGEPFGWTRIAYDETKEVKGQGLTNDDNNQVQITYDQIVASLGTDDFSGLTKLQCESDMEWEVFSVTIGEYAPEPYKYTDEVMLEGSAVKGNGWAQAGVDSVANGGSFDYTALVPGTVINIHYKDNGANFWLVVNAEDGAPYGWSRVGVEETGFTNTCRVDREKCIVQITYDDLAARLGSEDFSFIKQLQAESTADWEIYGIGIAKLAE